MNQSVKIFSLLIIFTLVCISSSYTADPPKDTGYDKYGKPLPGTQTTINPPLKGTGPVAEGNPLQGPVTPTVPGTACRDFEDYKNAAREILAIERNGGAYACPPGYHCEGYAGPGQCLYRCIKDVGVTQIYADDQTCHWNSCVGWRWFSDRSVCEAD